MKIHSSDSTIQRCRKNQGTSSIEHIVVVVEDSMSLSQCSEALGIHSSSIYAYFKSKIVFVPLNLTIS